MEDIARLLDLHHILRHLLGATCGDRLPPLRSWQLILGREELDLRPQDVSGATVADLTGKTNTFKFKKTILYIRTYYGYL